MSPLTLNPTLIQPPLGILHSNTTTPPSTASAALSPGPSPTPLILIHDGSGTTFSYHLLSSLSPLSSSSSATTITTHSSPTRHVHAIHNPRFWSGRPWTGGIPQMASIYIELVRTLFPPSPIPSPSAHQTTPIILGGWSLGGLIALEMASQLRGDTSLCVEGIVMIDSVYPHLSPDCQGDHHDQQDRESKNEETPITNQGTPIIVPYTPPFSPNCKPALRLTVQRSFRQSQEMVTNWTLPPAPPRSPPPSPTQKSNIPTTKLTTAASLLTLSPSPPSPSPSPSPSSSNSYTHHAHTASPSSSLSTPASEPPDAEPRTPSSMKGEKERDQFLTTLHTRLQSTLVSSASPSTSTSISSSTSSLPTPPIPTTTSIPTTPTSIATSSPTPTYPPTYLLRASHPVPVTSSQPGARARVDTHRYAPNLGWDIYSPTFITKSVSIPGHHYDVFSRQNVGVLSERLRDVCEEIDGGAEGCVRR